MKKGAKKIILLTIAPIPKIFNTESYRLSYKRFNAAIKSSKYGKKVKILDICPLFWADNAIRMDLFERFYRGSRGRIDLVHWNARGLRMVADHLREKLPPALE